MTSFGKCLLTVTMLAAALPAADAPQLHFNGMTVYHSADPAGRLTVNDRGHLVWRCRKPDQLVAHLQSPMDISRPGDLAEFRILWKSSGEILGPNCRSKLCHDDCVLCLAGTGDFRMGLFDSTAGARISCHGQGLESDAFRGWHGYQWRFSPHLQTDEPKRWYEPKPDGSRESHTNTRFWKRITPDDPSPLASRQSWSTMGHEPFAGGFAVPQNEFRLLSFKIERRSETDVTISITLNGRTFTRTDSDPNNQPRRIDTFAIHMPNARPYHEVVLAPARRRARRLDTPSIPKRILFIGNSYTYQNDLPQVLTRLLKSAKPSLDFTAEKSTKGGATLQRHFEDPATIAKIRQGDFDVIVLQEQSLRPVTDPSAMYDSARKLHAEIAKTGARTVFFMTWARRNKPEMTAALADAYNHISAELNSAVAPVGLAWARSIQQRPDLVLHRADNSHPTQHGTYLAACVFYATLLDANPAGLPNAGLEDISAAEAKFLQTVAWQTVMGQ